MRRFDGRIIHYTHTVCKQNVTYSPLFYCLLWNTLMPKDIFMIRKKLGLRIKELRKEKNFSQEELADLSGLDRTYINSVENGRRNISIINIEKISGAFNLTLKDFFNF